MDGTQESRKNVYAYDLQGNLLSDGDRQYSYDVMNRLAEVRNADGSWQKNHYDGEGLRAELEENGRLVRFIYDGDKAVLEGTDSSTIRHIRGYELVSSDSEAAKTYYHYASDELGSITHVTDADGNVLNRYEYDAFGDFTLKEETVENRFGFAGEQYDPVANLYYLRARFYNPVIGRFLQEDTYYGDGLNLYTYCHNNPVGYVDPSGHATKNCPNKQAAIDHLKEQGLSEEEAIKKYDEVRGNSKSAKEAREKITGVREEDRGGNGSRQNQIEQALNAQAKAQELSDKYGYGNKPKKTVASDGEINTLSGWKELPEDSEFTRVDPQKVIDKSNEIEHNLRNAGANDHGVPGKYNASHAEKQLSIITDKPIGISQPMCTDCQEYFKKLAQSNQKSYVTADPLHIRIFNSDGSVVVIER